MTDGSLLWTEVEKQSCWIQIKLQKAPYSTNVEQSHDSDDGEGVSQPEWEGGEALLFLAPVDCGERKN